MSIAHTNRGSKDNLVCNGIGTCKFDLGKCDCGDYYTFEDAFGGCGKPVVNTSAWVGVETCPGVVLQSDPTLAVDKPSSEARLYFGMSSNASKHSQHSRGKGKVNFEYSMGGCIYRVGIDHLHRFIMDTYFGHFV